MDLRKGSSMGCGSMHYNPAVGSHPVGWLDGGWKRENGNGYICKQDKIKESKDIHKTPIELYKPEKCDNYMELLTPGQKSFLFIDSSVHTKKMTQNLGKTGGSQPHNPASRNPAQFGILLPAHVSLIRDSCHSAGK